MKKISQRVVMSVPFPSSLGLAQQRRLATSLDALQSRIEDVAGLQTDVSGELEASLSAALGRIVCGSP